MDFEQFTRSMLLAQGGFTAFLQAQPDERVRFWSRSPVRRSIRSYRLRRTNENRMEQQKLDLLRDECSGILLPMTRNLPQPNPP